MEAQGAQLAHYYTEEFFRSKGLTTEQIQGLPVDEARQMWIEASEYAALKLTELESRAHVVAELRGITGTKT